MAELSIRNRQLPIQKVTALRVDQGLAATAAAKRNGADDVFIQVGQDQYVASGRGLALRGVKAGDSVTLDGKAGKVVLVDRQLNSFKDGLTAWPGLAVGGLGAAWGLVGFAQGMLTGATFAGLGLFLAVGAVAVGAAINLAPAAYGALRKVDYEAIGQAK